MKKLNLFLILIVAAMIVSCSSSPKKLLVGKWKPTGDTSKDKDAPSEIEFTKDKIKMSMGGASVEIDYEWAGDNQIKMKMMGEEIPAEIKVDKKTLTMTVEGEAQTFERL